MDNLKIFRLDVKYGRYARLFSWADITLLLNVIRNFRVDIIHLHWQHRLLLADSKLKTIIKSLLFICQVLVVKALGTKVVWTVHNLQNHEQKHKELELFFSSIIARLADAIIAHCEAANREIQIVFNVKENEKIAVVPQGNYLNVYKNSVSQNDARNRLNLSPTDLAFVYFGRIRLYKGLLELIESFQKLDSSHVKLIIVGEPGYEHFGKLLSKKAREDTNIQLILQFIPDDEVQIYLNAADIMVLPYRDVLNSGAAILGMSFGKAIIAPHLGCMSDVLGDSGGFLYDPGKEDGLLNAMRNALASRAKLREMGNYNLRLAKKLDWRDIAESTYRVYQRCLGR